MTKIEKRICSGDNFSREDLDQVCDIIERVMDHVDINEFRGFGNFGKSLGGRCGRRGHRSGGRRHGGRKC